MNTPENAPDFRLPEAPAAGYTLDRCPFCGAGAGRIGPTLTRPGDYRVVCWNCGASSTDAPNANYVIYQWNRRHDGKGKKP